MLDKLIALEKRFECLEAELASESIINDIDRYRSIVKERSELEPVILEFREYRNLSNSITECREMLQESDDPEFSSLIRSEIASLEMAFEKSSERLKEALIPKDPNDDKNVIIEIRAGTGGEEAALFAGDLVRMYLRYAERTGFRYEVLSANSTDMGGYKEIVLSFGGKRGAYSKLKYESGVHRVQRIPVTESQGKIQTSAATVAVLPEVDDIKFELKDSDLRIDTYRSSGAGGQHVNKTESAIRITHIPTGIVVQCQDEKSQLKNKEQALRVLKSRVYDFYESQRNSDISLRRKIMVGSGDRSERIRTYNFPQNRITDHRIGLTLHKLDLFLDGDIEEMIDSLVIADRAEKLKNGDQTE